MSMIFGAKAKYTYESYIFIVTTTHMKKIFILSLTFPLMLLTQAQKVIPLYDNQIPNSRPAKDEETRESMKDTAHMSFSLVSHPTLTLFLPSPEKANGTAVVICPGGGYVHLAMGHEGYEVAKRLNELGIAAFVLKYRLPSDSTMIDKENGPLQDAQRAIQLVRQRSAAWGVKPERIGILGFSAGGHLASTAGTHFAKAVIDNPAHTSLRPDFMILLYPVISFADSITHQGSRSNLLGAAPTSDKIWEYSNELQVSPQTPPPSSCMQVTIRPYRYRTAFIFMRHCNAMVCRRNYIFIQMEAMDSDCTITQPKTSGSTD